VKENKRLKGLLRFGEEIPRKKILAQIVGWDAASDFKVLRINKGLKDGIQLQSTVITSQGLVGYIYRLTNSFSDIITILDSNNRVDGIVQRTRSHGIVEGFSGRTCQMKYVKRAEPIILNDLVLTSGLGNIYPKGLKVGSISHIERESFGITQQVEITPAVDFGRLEEVVVLVVEGDEQRRRELETLNDIVEGKGKKK
jgi:rod shape-determining protein MreC